MTPPLPRQCRLLLSVLASTGCLGKEAGSLDASAEEGGMVADASIDISADPGGVACTAPLADAGFSSLADFPVAQICARLSEGGFGEGQLFESTPCQGLILVQSVGGSADCGVLWVFDARTGELKGDGFECDGFRQGYVCSAGVPGFRFPDSCNPLVDGGWSPTQPLCPLAGADAGRDVSADGDARSE